MDAFFGIILGFLIALCTLVIIKHIVKYFCGKSKKGVVDPDDYYIEEKIYGDGHKKFIAFYKCRKLSAYPNYSRYLENEWETYEEAEAAIRSHMVAVEKETVVQTVFHAYQKEKQDSEKEQMQRIIANLEKELEEVKGERNG